jgi:hypothetical protein
MVSQGEELSTPVVDNLVMAVEKSPECNVSSGTLAYCTRDRQTV